MRNPGHSVRDWDHDNSETLSASFDCAHWQVFHGGCSDSVDEIADTVMSYVFIVVNKFNANKNC